MLFQVPLVIFYHFHGNATCFPVHSHFSADPDAEYRCNLTWRLLAPFGELDIFLLERARVGISGPVEATCTRQRSTLMSPTTTNTASS